MNAKPPTGSRHRLEPALHSSAVVEVPKRLLPDLITIVTGRVGQCGTV